MSEVTIEVVGIPVPQGSHRVGLNKRTGAHMVVESNAKLAVWRRTISLAAQTAFGRRSLFAGPLTVDATFRLVRPKSVKTRVYPSVRPDLDKMLRALDALTGVVWVDDAQVVEISARKLYAETMSPGAMIIVREVSA